MRRRAKVRLAFVFPRSESTGEALSLYRLARALPEERYEIQFVECIHGATSPRFRRGIFRRYACSSLAHERIVRGARRVEPSRRELEKLLRSPPDAIVVSEYYQFVSLRSRPASSLFGFIHDRLLPHYFPAFERLGVPVMALDVVGLSYVERVPPSLVVLSPRPFGYGRPKRQHRLFWAGGPSAPTRALPSGPTRVVWLASDWMLSNPLFRATERIALRALSHLGDAAVLSSTRHPTEAYPLPFLGNAEIIPRSLSFEAMDDRLAAFDVAVTPNATSTIGARALAKGVPVVWFDARRVLAAHRDGRLVSDGATLRLLDSVEPGADINVWCGRAPREVAPLDLSEDAAVGQLRRALTTNLPELRRRLARQLRGYRAGLPDFETVLRAAISEGSSLSSGTEPARPTGPSHVSGA